MGSEEVPTQMVEVLILLYMDVLKEDPVKGKLSYRQNWICTYLNKAISLVRLRIYGKRQIP